MTEQELMHYGVLGMKWGVIRTPEQLGRKVQRLENKTEKLRQKKTYYDQEADSNFRKSVVVRRNNSNQQAKIDDAAYKLDRLNRKLDKARKSNSGFGDYDKEMKLERKITKQEKKVQKNEQKLVDDIWRLKHEEYSILAADAKEKIERNEDLMRVYKQTIKSIDEGTIQQGRYFMRYVDD